MPATSLSTLLVLILHCLVFAVSAQCPTCNEFANDLKVCSKTNMVVYGDGTFPGNDAIDCMCNGQDDGRDGLFEMKGCLVCNSLNGTNLELLEAWATTCTTRRAHGVDQARQCWNSDFSKGCDFEGNSTKTGSTSIFFITVTSAGTTTVITEQTTSGTAASTSSGTTPASTTATSTTAATTTSTLTSSSSTSTASSSAKSSSDGTLACNAHAWFTALSPLFVAVFLTLVY